MDPKIYDGYSGRYELDPDFVPTIANEEDKLRLGSSKFSVTKEADKLIGQAGVQRFELFPESETEFFIKEFYGRVSFVKDEKGQVTGVIHRERDETHVERELRLRKII